MVVCADEGSAVLVGTAITGCHCSSDDYWKGGKYIKVDTRIPLFVIIVSRIVSFDSSAAIVVLEMLNWSL